MIRLDRRGFDPPEHWAGHVEGAFNDFSIYESACRDFERVDLNHADRRGGFKSFAPHSLPATSKGPDFPPVWRTKKYVKVALREMSHFNCAYCQNPHAAGGFGEVEHYRPKSLFPALAYSWENYFFSCRLCNHTKSNKWPQRGEYVRPDDGDPESRFVFRENGMVEAAAGDEAAVVMIEDFGLNREVLVVGRRNVIGPALEEIQRILDRELPRDLAQDLILDKLKPPSFPYSAAVNQLIRRRIARFQ